MLLVIQLAALALGVTASCPSNLANDLAAPPPPSTSQLITVEAPTARATYATARTWTRIDGCWAPLDGPYAARVGRNGVRRNKREGDGATPAGTFRIGAMYGNSPSPGVSYPYVRLRCGDWWVEDSKSPSYNTFQRNGCGRRPPVQGDDTRPVDVATRIRTPCCGRIQHASRRARSRLRDLHPRTDRPGDERLHQPAPPRTRARASLARFGCDATDRDRSGRLPTTTATRLMHPRPPRS